MIMDYKLVFIPPVILSCLLTFSCEGNDEDSCENIKDALFLAKKEFLLTSSWDNCEILKSNAARFNLNSCDSIGNNSLKNILELAYDLDCKSIACINTMDSINALKVKMELTNITENYITYCSLYNQHINEYEERLSYECWDADSVIVEDTLLTYYYDGNASNIDSTQFIRDSINNISSSCDWVEKYFSLEGNWRLDSLIYYESEQCSGARLNMNISGQYEYNQADSSLEKNLVYSTTRVTACDMLGGQMIDETICISGGNYIDTYNYLAQFCGSSFAGVWNPQSGTCDSSFTKTFKYSLDSYGYNEEENNQEISNGTLFISDYSGQDIRFRLYNDNSCNDYFLVKE